MRVASNEAQYDNGKIIMLSFAVQPHGTFRLLFNSILSSTTAEMPGG